MNYMRSVKRVITYYKNKVREGEMNMVDTFKHFFHIMEQSNKKVQIEHSGSIQGNTREKVRSGQSYLYKCSGMESEVFEVRLKENVRGSFLNEALRLSIKRYPYLNAKMIELDGDFYIVRNDITPVARKMEKLPVLGGISNGYHLIDVTFWEKSIFVSFHHALCDGRGIKPFIETLLYYYCKGRYKSTASAEGIRMSTDPLLPDETKEPFLGEYEYDTQKEMIDVSKDGFAIPENKAEQEKNSYRYEVIISQNEMMFQCKQSNATPAIMLALLMNETIAKLYPDFDKPIHANIATDMREALGVENTFKNCVKTIVLPYDKEFSKQDLQKKATTYRELLRMQRDVDYCRKEANTMLGLFNKLDTLPSLEEKQKIMAFFESMILNSYVISYIGQFILNENEQYVDEIHLYNSGVVGLGINMICCSGKFILDFKQSFPSDKYVRGFEQELTNLGISFEESKSVEFTTPKDNIISRI
jgi:hypothetical protein